MSVLAEEEMLDLEPASNTICACVCVCVSVSVCVSVCVCVSLSPCIYQYGTGAVYLFLLGNLMSV